MHVKNTPLLNGEVIDLKKLVDLQSNGKIWLKRRKKDIAWNMHEYAR